jgi:hypothetical protein
MARLRGRARRGQRLKMKAPFGHWGTQTFVAGLRHDGLTAPWVINGPMNRRIFETYVETQLAPTLKPGDMVILDNLSSQKTKRPKRSSRHPMRLKKSIQINRRTTMGITISAGRVSKAIRVRVK